jgi:hypothetical protein
MKRDMELVRTLLLSIEESPKKPSWKDLAPQGSSSDLETEKILEHLKLIEEAGFTKSVIVGLQGYRLPENIELTWKGHEFLADVRDPDIWSKTKERAKGVASVGVGFLWDIAKAELKAKLGIP